MLDERLGKQADRSDTVEVIQTAIAEKLAISFRYERSDGTVSRHNAVYPKELFRRGQHTLMRAYCHFTHDSRVFRTDRIRSIRLGAHLLQIPLRHDVLGFLVALVLIIAVFTVLLLFSPKYRWRQLRHQLLGPQTNIEGINQGGKSPNRRLPTKQALVAAGCHRFQSAEMRCEGVSEGGGQTPGLLARSMVL